MHKMAVPQQQQRQQDENGAGCLTSSSSSSSISSTRSPPSTSSSPSCRGVGRQMRMVDKCGKEDGRSSGSFKVLLSAKFVFLSVAAASAIAFGVGQVCRAVLVRRVLTMSHHNRGASGDHQLSSPGGGQPWSDNGSTGDDEDIGMIAASSSRVGSHVPLPQPTLPAGKRMPNTLYTTRQLNTDIPTSRDSVLLARAPPTTTLERRLEKHKIVRSIEISPDGTSTAAAGRIATVEGDNASSPSSTTAECPTNNYVDGTQGVVEEEEEEEVHHEPAGQHLLIDIANVDGHFLNSEERLATAMIELVNESGLTMLSYHCHSLEPVGVSCVAVLLESHVSFHTWPVEGVITLDVFTCGPNPLRPLVKVVERLFGIPRKKKHQQEDGQDDDVFQPPRVNWILKNRGFPSAGSVSANPETVEIRQFLLGWMEYDLKEEVATVETDYQTIEVFNVINPRFRTLENYKKSLSKDGSYESLHPEHFRPDRVVYLDGIMQSRRYGEVAYHESLVHPAMFAHDEPRNVAIIGGGEGATLREVLKHDTVLKVTMVEIDGGMVNASKTLLPEWSYCGDIEGSEESCFDDPRTDLVVTDAIGWFISKFGGNKAAKMNDEDKYDVIIMDALDPSSIVEFSDVLYNNDDLIRALSNALTEGGVLVAQVGEAGSIDDPPIEYTREGVLETAFIPQLKRHGFEKVKDYEDFHGGFMGVWNYLIAFKSAKASQNWYLSPAAIDLNINKRIRPTVSGKSSLYYFDGASMRSLAYPTRIVEEVDCRKVEAPKHCGSGHGDDPQRHNVPIEALEMRTQADVAGAGRGLFYREDAPKDSYLAIDERSNAFLVLPETVHLIKDMAEFCRRWEMFGSYMFDYGYTTELFGDPAYLVDSGIMTFINHGCNNTNNVNLHLSVTEMTADPRSIPPELDQADLENYVYSPYLDRNYHRLIQAAFTNRDVKAGEEVLDNYLPYLHAGNWEWGVQSYRSMCMQASPGVVTAYEDNDDRGVVY